MRRLSLALSIVCLSLRAAHAQTADARGEPAATLTSRLQVLAIPPGARVTIDGEPSDVGNGLFLVPAGMAAEVAVVFDGEEPAVRRAEVTEGRITRLEVTIGERGSTRGGSFAGQGGPSGPGGFVAGGGVGGISTGPAVVKVPGLRSTRSLAKPLAPLSPLDGLLGKPVDMAFAETPLRAAAAAIVKATDADVTFDLRALRDSGIDVDTTTVTARSTGLPLAIFLDTVCRDLGLAWSVRDRDVMITTPDADQQRLLTHIHDVSDLITDDFPALIDAIQCSIGPETWNVAGGPGSIGPDSTTAGSFLVVNQTFAVQRRVAGFLARLRALKAAPAAERTPLAAEGYWSDSTRAATIRSALDRIVPGRIEFTEMPLPAALAQVAEATGVSIAIDDAALADAGVDFVGTQVTDTMREVPVARLLERLLDEIGLVACVQGEQLVVTTADAEKLSVAVYPVDRLLATGRNVTALIEMLHANVKPDAWQTMGGPAVVKPLDGDAPCLVVSHTTAGHRAVDRFLGALR